MIIGVFRCPVCLEFRPIELLEDFGTTYICRRHIRANEDILNKIPFEPELIPHLVKVILANMELKGQVQIAVDMKNTNDNLQKNNTILQKEIKTLKFQVEELTKMKEDHESIINCNNRQIEALSRKQDVIPFMEALTKKVSILESSIKDKKEEDKAIRIEISGFVNELGMLKSALAQNEKNTIASLRADINSNSNEIKQILEAFRTNIQSEISETRKYVKQYDETIHEMIKAELKTVVEPLNRTLTNQINSANKINEIETKIDAMEITLNCCMELVESKLEHKTSEIEESDLMVDNSVEHTIKTQLPTEITNMNHTAIYNCLKSTPSTPNELIDATGINRQSVYDSLNWMKSKGFIIQNGYGGKYHIRE